ncbi:hypothetical protein SELMODRAFT_422675 [Selaginella moellendorffii]|uniref:Uncharacterized protein n=1 Tax=Selaginella moellendorffii TaxID=88036 RepID=D8SJ66_SELML|nr:hypothetical protein SELMODRAFT_422675 [Selaginella moellendorffii]
MSSRALARDSRFKQYMKKTAYVQWEEEQEMNRHKQRLRHMTAAIDNSSPFYFSAAQNRCRQLQEEERLHVIEDENLALLGRLHAISNRETRNWHCRKPKALIRGDAYRYYFNPPRTPLPSGQCIGWIDPQLIDLNLPRLRKPSGKRVWLYDWQALKGSTMRKSLRVQEEVLRKLVSMKMVDPKEEKWLRKWLPRPKEGPLDVLRYNKATEHKDGEAPSPVDADPEDLAKKTASLKIK